MRIIVMYKKRKRCPCQKVDQEITPWTTTHPILAQIAEAGMDTERWQGQHDGVSKFVTLSRGVSSILTYASGIFR
jgi:hypothetical protein